MRRDALLEAIIQSAAVGLFEAFELAVAPAPSIRTRAERVRWSDPVAVSSFEGRCLNGALLLSIPDAVYPLMQRGVEPGTKQRDLLRELANQLAGRIKNRLSQFQAEVRCVPPIVLDAASRKRRFDSQEILLYGFRSLRGEVYVGFDGKTDETALVYSGTGSVHREGDVLVF
jgi:hypothetical protein